MPAPDMSGFRGPDGYQRWAAAVRASGENPTQQAFDNQMRQWSYTQEGSILGQTGGGTEEQRRTGAMRSGSFADDSSDAGNANTGDPYLDELRSGRVAGSEDWRRFSNAQLKAWEPYYIGGGKFKNTYGDIVGKPIDSGPNTPKGYDGLGENIGGGARGGGGGGGGRGAGGGGRGGSGTYGGAPAFRYEDFVPPSYEDAVSDPGYQFALGQGMDAMSRSAAARGTLRTGGTLKDLIDYGQAAGAQQYQNVFDRAASTYGINRDTARDIFAPRYGSWQTTYGGNLQKYLQRENNIYGLLNQPPPQYPGYY